MTTTPTPRPAGVFWARTAPGSTERLCTDTAHAVYERSLVPAGGVTARRVYACAVCWPRAGAPAIAAATAAPPAPGRGTVGASAWRGP